MITLQHISLFDRYLDAPNYAYGGGGNPSIVTEEDKELYWEIHGLLTEACEEAVADSGNAQDFYVKPRAFSRERGARGHRPLDLWCAIRNKDSSLFNEMPQIYVIASHRGVEVGFAVSIPESDYHDQAVKLKNREIIPQIHRKLPASGEVVDQLDQLVSASSNWHVNAKTRLMPEDEGFEAFQKPSDLFGYLKTEVVSYGGGAICQVIPPDQIPSNGISIKGMLDTTLGVFSEVLRSCAPTEPDKALGITRNFIQSISQAENFYVPENLEDGREKKLQAVAVRQGQGKFRNGLLEAYEGRCAITGCSVTDVLQAAHIVPYKGEQTNHIQNGILLRSDIHDLFDLFLLSVDPATYLVKISGHLIGSEYSALNGTEVWMPQIESQRPSAAAFEWHFYRLIT
jgi:hypothetical protein